MKTKLFILMMAAVLAGAGLATAGTNEVSALLQKGLFEEEANRNLDAAIQAYQSVITQTDKDHQFAATAIFRLGECYRKQGKTNEANMQYQRILREFPDQAELLKLSREYAGSSATVGTAAEQEVTVTPAEAEEIKRLQAMIKDSPDLINGSDGGSSPLNSAARKGQLAVAKFLLDNKADTEVVDDFAKTPLLLAAQFGRKEMVELLLEQGASVNAAVIKEKVAKNAMLNSGENGRTSLHYAAFYGYKAVAETLLAHGAKVDARNAEGETPLYYSAQKGFKTVAEALLAGGADANARDHNGNTALFAAISAGNKAIAELLLARGASVNGQNTEGKTVLFAAVTAGNKAMIDVLLANKADLNLKAKDGLTPLIAAINAGQSETAALLLEHGADPNARMADDHQSTPRWTALDAAVVMNNNPLVQLLLEKHADPNATFDLSDRGNIYLRDSTPLIWAAEQGRKETAQILLARKAGVNWKNSQGMTALLEAMTKDDREMAAILLDNKADTEIKSNIGNRGVRTVLQHEAEFGKKEMAELLLAHGAQVNARDEAGSTALHLAVSAGSSAMVDLLLAHGADVNLKDNQGNTALDLAGNQPGSGNVFSVTGAGAAPLNYQWQFNGNPETSGTTKDIGTLLRQHGAISALERGTIRITRSGQTAQGVVFRQDAHVYNHHTLFEVIAYVYPHQLGLAYFSPTLHRNRQPELPGFYFPDFAHVKIRRLESNGRTNILNVDLEAALNSGDCSKNLDLKWGDIVELPELDHNVSENWSGLPQPIREALKKCLERHVEIIVKGKVTKVTLAPALPTGGGSGSAPATETSAKVELPIFWLSDVVHGAKVILASSDLTGVKVRHVDPATGKTGWLAFSLDKIDEQSDLWLQDGDVIEIPEKQ